MHIDENASCDRCLFEGMLKKAVGAKLTTEEAQAVSGLAEELQDGTNYFERDRKGKHERVRTGRPPKPNTL